MYLLSTNYRGRSIVPLVCSDGFSASKAISVSTGCDCLACVTEDAHDPRYQVEQFITCCISTARGSSTTRDPGITSSTSPTCTWGFCRRYLWSTTSTSCPRTFERINRWSARSGYFWRPPSTNSPPEKPKEAGSWSNCPGYFWNTQLRSAVSTCYKPAIQSGAWK